MPLPPFDRLHVQSCGAIVRFFSPPPTREEVQAEKSHILYGQDEKAEVVDVEGSTSENDIADPEALLTAFAPSLQGQAEEQDRPQSQAS
jgi:hypothetical protein